MQNDREYFKDVSTTQRMSNEKAQARDEIEMPEAETIEPYPLVEVEREPPEAKGSLMRLTKSEKINKCDKCSYQSDRKGALKRHKLTHDKPIACSFCLKKVSVDTDTSFEHHQIQKLSIVTNVANRSQVQCT